MSRKDLLKMKLYDEDGRLIMSDRDTAENLQTKTQKWFKKLL